MNDDNDLFEAPKRRWLLLRLLLWKGLLRLFHVIASKLECIDIIFFLHLILEAGKHATDLSSIGTFPLISDVACFSWYCTRPTLLIELHGNIYALIDSPFVQSEIWNKHYNVDWQCRSEKTYGLKKLLCHAYHSCPGTIFKKSWSTNSVENINILILKWHWNWFYFSFLYPLWESMDTELYIQTITLTRCLWIPLRSLGKYLWNEWRKPHSMWITNWWT